MNRELWEAMGDNMAVYAIRTIMLAVRVGLIILVSMAALRVGASWFKGVKKPLSVEQAIQLEARGTP